MGYRVAAINEITGRPLSWSETKRHRGLRMLLGRRYAVLGPAVAAELAARDVAAINLPADVGIAVIPETAPEAHPNLAA